ncbi:NAD(P)H-hydrate dehydratase [Croceibacterium ferulae]|uniref:NAD(P)H-hydrate dehydratase n=1 Tax=Croceibacterium ferulae TaxID=1854641 RepID=UPI000EB0EF33|nr:NAD(P)H-hydrate dehydratase [Croceibacterium ferulae]
MIEIDAAWRAANPLPPVQDDSTKKSRGRVLVIGGAQRLPGAIRLTGEAALRVGAGRVRIATLQSHVALLGMAFPEAGIIGLPEQDGELTPGPSDLLVQQAAVHNAVVLGSGMADKDAAARLIETLGRSPAPGTALVLDAAGVACARTLCDQLNGYTGRLVLTPHAGEMAALSGRSEEEVVADGTPIAIEVAARFGAVVALKGPDTVIATPDGTLMHYRSDCSGLATAGSGDVLAGMIGGLLARGADPLLATAWGVWLHGEAGHACAAKIAPVGFLARELLLEVPGLLPR